MDQNPLSDKEKQKLIEHMLSNGALEEAVIKWSKSKASGEDLLNIMNALAGRAAEQGGLILSVKCEEIPTGAEHIELFTADKPCKIWKVEDRDGKDHAMVFTSRERFAECSDTSGIVLFLDDLFILLEYKKELDGIVINLGREEVILDKFILRGALWLLKKKKEKAAEASEDNTEQ